MSSGTASSAARARVLHLGCAHGRVKNGAARARQLSPACLPFWDALNVAVASFQIEAMRALLDVILIVLQLYVWLLIAAAVLSWLIAFNVVNPRNQAVAVVADFLFRITEPVLRPILNALPNRGGLDISPVLASLASISIQKVIEYDIYPYVF